VDIPEIRFARSGDVHIAYQIVGDGPVDLVFICDWIWNVELQWENSLCASFLERLASFSRLLLFDKRGSGLSDRTVDLDLFTLEVRIDDVRAVMEAAASEQAILLGHGDDGAALAAVFAAANPDRTRALILYGSRAKTLKAPDYPWGYEPSAPDVWTAERESFWGTDAYARRWLRELAPSLASDDRIVRWYSRLLRQSASPGTEEAYSRWAGGLDLHGMLSAIHVPTLVLHRTGDRDVPIEGGRDVADRIAGARFVELPGVDAFPWAGDSEPLLAEVEAFVTGAQAIGDAVTSLGIVIRAGCHTGEIELVGDDVRGITVHIGARVAALAGPSDVLVSSTVRDLVAGSGLAFEDAGEHELKGVPDRWRLYRVVA
jgi:pimeloyl-ACP methyl ester carboxylesterase